MRKAMVLAGLLLLALGTASAQQSASFKLEEIGFNAGGHPQAGTILTSASFQITLDAIGEGVVSGALNSLSFGMESGFGSAYPTPGEAENLRFTDATTLVWDPERSAGDYALYQGQVTNPFDLDFGMCNQPPPALTSATATVTDTPAPGGALFYLVTARNRLGEEGTKGAGRPNTIPCP